MTHSADDMTYGQYLDLQRILDAQHPISDQHDELLFIVIHQTKELWLKQIIHELRHALEMMRRDEIVPVYKILARVSRIQAVMTLSWDILTTMTPADYTRFRDVLGTSSGFQSAQFREVEYLLGFKDPAFLKYHPEGSPEHAALKSALEMPSLWAEANRAAARAGLPVPETALERDWSQSYAPSEAVEEAWAEVYRDTEKWWDLYSLAEKLVDLDDAFATWRHRHILTVSRIIGGKRGTGGTAGVPYLLTTLDKRAFPELWSLRTRL